MHGDQPLAAQQAFVIAQHDQIMAGGGRFGQDGAGGGQVGHRQYRK